MIARASSWLLVGLLSLVGCGILCLGHAHADPLTTLEYHIVGTQLRVSPVALSVPKNVAGSILVQLSSGTNVSAPNSLAANSYVEATLRGPSFPARKLVGAVNTALLLPPLNLVGDYQLDNIRLVDGTTGETKLQGVPPSVPVHVFDDVLVSTVTSRPLTLQEIQEKGIAIDDANFHAIEFNVGFVLNGNVIPVKFPVIAPTFNAATEIIPQAELDAKLAQATILNQQIASTVKLPPQLEQSGLNIQIQGINFQEADVTDADLQLQIPPIPALMVIPGNIGFLNQFFSVQIFTENGAPIGSGLTVNNLQATLNLPPGPDLVLSTNYNAPGDDPLRFARIGPNKIVQPTQPVVRPGPDGKLGTADDIPRLQPGESGQGEFLVEGLQEGLAVMNLDLTANLEGLAAGVVKIKGKAAGSVLVRNPKFSLTFIHPRTVRSGEPYEAKVTVLNTSSSPANLVRVSLPATALSGGVLKSAETVELGTVQPGQSATATFRIRSQKTGAVVFSNLSTSDDSTQGRFLLSMGIDERGVALSPDTLAMPDYVNALPTNLVAAASRVLGQALSIATAGQLPAGVLGIPKSIITQRVLELAEAGQRVTYGETMNRVLIDLLLDWQGGRAFDQGFDQILRVTDAGGEYRQALMTELEATDNLDAAGRLSGHAADLAGRGERWALAASGSPGIELSLNQDTASANLDSSDVPFALGYGGQRGHWFAVGATVTNAVFRWTVTNGIPSAALVALLVDTNGTAQQLTWTITNPPVGSCYSFALQDLSNQLQVDLNCDGTPDGSLQATVQAVTESPPQVLAVVQDPTVEAGRPSVPCSTVPYDPRNYGTVLAVLFSKSMTQNGVDLPGAYRLDNGNPAHSVQIQPSARVALLNMAQPLGGLIPRSLSVTDVSDPRGHPVTGGPTLVRTDLIAGTSIRGRVVRADGSFAAAVPVTLTYYDLDASGDDCVGFTVRASQVFTDQNGRFAFDFVVAGIPYSVSATDTSGLSAEAIQIILESAAGDTFAKSKLLELLNAQTNQTALLSAFGTTDVPQAVAQAEGLDRALLRDLVPLGSGREGTETVIALRFRGRGTVIGQVLASDGSAPLSGVAVNLFPDPDSRELGRGVLSDNNGRFAFYGVPLGVFTVQATAATGQARTVAGVLDQVGQTNNLSIVLSTVINPLAALHGRVFEPDAVTPHAGAHVFMGHFDDQGRLAGVVAAAVSDANGFWAATNFPAGLYDVAAVSFDGQRKGDRRAIQASAGLDTDVSITLNGRTTVSGRVEFFNGLAAPNALVAGGDIIVRTDSQGRFTLTGVPTGNSTISAGLERDPAGGIDFPRLGSASLNVIAGVDNFVVVRLVPAGRITGRVLDVLGAPVPKARVVIPEEHGFIYVDADDKGVYLFENLALGDYKLSAPGPAVADTDTSGLVDQIRGAQNSDQIMAAIGEAAAIFAGTTDPFLNGTPFNPVTWGFNRTQLTFDGQTAVADIQLLRPGTVSGVVLNGQGVPIGAKVRLTGLGPLANGAPSFVIRGEVNSDPAEGTFAFTNALLSGPFGLQAASPFFSAVISTNGQTTDVDPDAKDLVLQFPPTRETGGRLTGTVFYPDGTPTGSNVDVKISFGLDTRTDTNGFFDSHIALPAIATGGTPGVGYTLEADDPLTGLRGTAVAVVLPGATNTCNVRLIGKGALTVLVSQANGAPATNATVEISGTSFPNDSFTGTTDTKGLVNFGNLFAGPYAVLASFITGPTTINGRIGAVITTGQTSSVTVVLGPTATVRGVFVQKDLATPVGFAQVALGSLGFTTTGADGKFQVNGVPLGTYRLVSQDPVTGIGAVVNLTLSVAGETHDVTLVEQSRAELRGGVIDPYGVSFVSGANVTLTVSDGLTPPRTVSTGPDGQFSFPGTPAGAFSLDAQDPSTHVHGGVSGVLPDGTTVFSLNVPLQPLARLAVIVFDPDGVTPATNATVQLIGPRAHFTTDTDGAGRAAFADVPLDSYSVRADSLQPAQTHSAILTNLVVLQTGDAPDFPVTLLGVGSVSGKVFLSDGNTPAVGAEVTLTSQAPLFIGTEETTFAGAAGEFTFNNVAVGPYTVSAKAVALGTAAGAEIATDGQADQLTLVLGASGTVVGRLVRADGSNAGNGIDVTLTFASQSSLPGIAAARTDSTGVFTFANIPVGPFDFETIAPSFNGIARFSSQITTNGQTNDLGVVTLDEEDPRVLSVNPAPTAVGVPITTTVSLVFSEALATNSINTNGVLLRSDTQIVNSSLRLLPDPTNGILRVIEISPHAPLKSQVTYQVIVVDGTRLDAVGNTSASGPTDLVGRPLAAPFISTFTTADNDPPILVSQTPTNGAVQVDPRAVIRLSFNEPIQPSNIVFTLSGPAGPVAGQTSVGVNGLVLTFTPTAALDVNATFTYSVSGVRDLAGNLAVNQPFSASFATLDTLGPTITTLRLATNQLPVAGATVRIEALLAANEPGASVRFTQDLNPIGSASSPPFSVAATLPTSDKTTIRAIATDRFGNDGPLAELTLSVQSNQPPAIVLQRVVPGSGVLTNGEVFSISVSATDDVAVSNIVVVGLGATPFATNFTGGSERFLSFSAPTDAPPGQLVEFRAQATDFMGAKSGEAILDLVLADTAPPLLAILSPADNTLLSAGQPLNLRVTTSDNSTNYQLQVVLSGAAASTQIVAIASPPNVPVTNTFTFPLDGVITDGASIAATVRATDAATNVTEATRTFLLPDTRPPQLASINPTNGAGRQSLWLPAATFDFDEALAPATATTNNVRFADDSGLPIGFDLALVNAGKQLRLLPSHPLQPGITYTNVLLPGLTDIAGNPWRTFGGGSVPNEGVPFAFTTAKVLGITPTNGTVFGAGQDLPVDVHYESEIAASFFRFRVNGGPAIDVPAGPNHATALFTAPLGVTQAVVTITAAADPAFSEPLSLPPVTLKILPDVTPPRLLATSPLDGSLRQPLWMTSGFDFDEALDPASVAGNVTVTNSIGQPTDFESQLANNNQRLLVSLHRPLLPGVVYTNILLPGLADPSGNRWRNLGDTIVPTGGAPFVFTTATILGVSPTNGSTLLAGQGVTATVGFEPGLGANFFRFQVSGGAPVQAAAGPTNVSALLFMPTSPTQAVISISASPDLTFSEAYDLPPVTVQVVAPATNHGLFFTGPNHIELVEGATDVLTLNVTGTNSPIVLLDYSPDKPPPAFVSVKSRLIANTSSNGFATIELEFNPLHDAAGTHTFTLHAASATGESATLDIEVVVADNPSLTETHWKDPVDGNWSDATKWSAGLPATGTVAVIDAVGNYTVALDTSVTAAGIVFAHTNATLVQTTSTTLSAPFELRSGRFENNTGQTLVIDRPLVNLGTMRWVSANRNFSLAGTGLVENRGLWEIFQDPAAANGFESTIGLPVDVPVGGQLLVSTNAFVDFTSKSSLTVAGTLEVQSGARLRLDSSDPARDLTLANGSLLAGSGTIRFEGSNRLVALSSASLDIGLLDLSGNATIAGTNLLTIPIGSVLRLDHSSTFSGSLTVDGTLTLIGASSTFDVNGTLTLDATGTINNDGTIHAGAFVRNGGTINGDFPQTQLGPPPLIITSIGLSPTSTLARIQGDATSSRLPLNIVLVVSASGDRSFAVESSSDLILWNPVAAAIQEAIPGQFRVTLSIPDQRRRFFRLRLLDISSTPR